MPKPSRLNLFRYLFVVEFKDKPESQELHHVTTARASVVGFSPYAMFAKGKKEHYSEVVEWRRINNLSQLQYTTLFSRVAITTYEGNNEPKIQLLTKNQTITDNEQNNCEYISVCSEHAMTVLLAIAWAKTASGFIERVANVPRMRIEEETH